jgi:hypothetical protein
VGPDGAPAIFLYDKNGQGRAVLNLVAGVAPLLEFYNKEGEPRVSLRLNHDDQTNLFLFDKSKKQQWSAP